MSLDEPAPQEEAAQKHDEAVAQEKVVQLIVRTVQRNVKRLLPIVKQATQFLVKEVVEL